MEKRSWPRKASRFNASLSLASHEHSCVIRDFSQTGVLATLNEDAREWFRQHPIVPAATASLHLDLPGRIITLTVQLARITDQGVGLRLVNPASDHYYALQQAADLVHVSAPARKASESGKKLDPAKQHSLAHAASAIFRQFLDNHLPDYFEQLEVALLDRADRQRSQAAQHPFFDAITLLRKQRTLVMATVISRMDDAALHITSGGRTAKNPIAREPAASTPLELVDKSDFEDWLLVRVAVSRADSSVGKPLIELQLRIDAAFSGSSETRLFNPFSPTALCHTLFEAIRPMSLQNAPLEVIFTVLQTTVLGRLSGVYTELNRLFSSTAALPKPTPKPAPETPAHAKAASTEGRTADAKAVDRQPAVSSTKIAPPNSIANNHAPNVSNTLSPGPLSNAYEIASQLLSLQRQLGARAPSRFVMGQREQDAAGLVEDLFQSITLSDHIAEDLRADLHSLQVPLLRILLTDPELFSAAEHPARQAMNHLVLLADRNSINLDINRKPVRQTIRRILSCEDDIDGFRQALPGLGDLVVREQRIIDRNRRRLREQCAGQQQLLQATRHVEHELRRLLDRAVPQPVIDLVEQGWRELMRLAFLRHGADSRVFAETLGVLDEILRHLQPSTTSASKPPRPAQTLVELVTEGLSRVSEATRSRDRLIYCIRQLLQTGISPATPIVHYTGAELDSDILDTRLATLTETETDGDLLRWHRRARALELGQWFACTASISCIQPMQLLWMTDDASQFMLVNRQGTRHFTLTVAEIAKHLRDGSLKALQDADLPPVDQGLNALIQTMTDKLAFDSAHDPLTGLLARKAFFRNLTQSLERARVETMAFTLIFIDIQQFKVINNTCGYEAGDRFLCETAAHLRAVASTAVGPGKDAFIGRMGADQFALILPVPSEKLGYRIAVDIKAAIETTRFVERGDSFVIDAAFAICGFDQRNQNAMELLRSVEAAAQLSSRAGSRDIQIVLPGDGRLEEFDEVMAWVTRINRAMDGDKLRLRCRKIAPVGNTDGKKLPYYEIMLTVIDERGEHTPPADFIKTAEAYIHTGSVDRWVIETVLRWIQEHPEHIRLFGGFSINLSSHSMDDDRFMDFIFDALVRYQVPRDKLIFAITESTAVASLEDAVDFISEMRSIGCRFSLDDFGVGQSSYSHLKRLPVDFIKIDGSFIQDIASSNVDYALVKSITEMGHYLNKQVVAEDVSDPDILATITDIGVDYTQGPVHGESVLLDDLTADTRDMDRQAI